MSCESEKLSELSEVELRRHLEYHQGQTGNTSTSNRASLPRYASPASMVDAWTS